ncbi:MAG: aminodeoxychorismate synthase component I [Rhodospirillales bacterium]|jgi:para-aminobenzoate synthetase / 4-amino-4-deoxychorismate lyase|nr:aminodeoxychorismate synthase component I [Rhodospirillales bacterium]
MVGSQINNLKDQTFVLLDDRSSSDGECVFYTDPVEIIEVHTPDQIEAGLAAIEGAGARGLHAAGHLAYELGYLLEPSLRDLWPGQGDVPLMWFGLFKTRQTFPARDYETVFGVAGDDTYEITNVTPSIERERYLDDAVRVKEYLVAGDVYQVNYTFNLHFDFAGDAFALYGDLRRKQHAAHGAIIWAPEFRVISASPEMFVHVDGEHIKTRPMKGTLKRSMTLEDDIAAKEGLRNDPKSQAENLMIVDLLRNDIGKLADVGSVKVTDLFQIETYPTLHQMTSTIEATLRDGISVSDVIVQAFPCGSVTGAPKVRAMEIIHELESEPRGIYTGSIGAFDADGTVRLNVAIRTITLIDENFATGVLGIGSAIVYDSSNKAEFDECLLKAKFVTEPPRQFCLLETMLWRRDEGFVLIDSHVQRMMDSALYFNRIVSRETILQKLDEIEKPTGHDLRLRLLLDENGELEIESFPIELFEQDDAPVLMCVLWDVPVNSADPYLYHKTTERQVFDQAFASIQETGKAQEVLFINEVGELTEGSRTNIFIERGGVLLTPPVSCGLLDGTLRRKLLNDGLYDGMPVREKILYPDDLKQCDAIYLGNSIRGMQRAIFEGANS